MSTTSDAVAVEVPDIGDFEDVPIIEILVSVGDSVSVEDPLVTLESDKATMDVPAPLAGVVKEISVSVGDRVSQGSVLMSLEGADGGAGSGSGSGSGDPGGGEPAEAAAAADREAEPTTAPAESLEAPSQPEAPASEAPERDTAEPSPPPAPARTNGGGPIYASPSARRLARELGVDLRSVTGSGRKGRITKDDVRNLADG